MATTGHESELVTIAGLKGALQQYKTSVSDTKMNASLKGAANGVAELDSNGKVPAAQLPSFVDDIIEGYLYNGKFYKEAAHTTEITGEGGKIYTDLSTNKTYRWSGSAYTQIKGDLVIGTSAGTAADGKVVADHVANTTVHITAAERTSWNAKGSYSKPSGGIPKTDLASGVQTSLGLADTAIQKHQDISGKADKSSTVSNVSYDTNNKKITKTINGTTSDVVTASTIVTNGGGLKSHQTIKQDGVTGATVNRFGTCSTDAATAAKTVSITTGTFSLEAGARVSVKFANANTAGSPTLNVNSKGAKNIFHKGAQITSGRNKSLLAGVCDFIYDGTQWHLVGNYTDTTYTSKSAASGGTDVSLVTTGEKYTWNNKGTYSKPSGGIPKTDLASAVQTSLGKADSALQEHQDISGKADAATTLAGYGITDAKIENGVITLGENTITPLTSHQDISGKQNKVAKLGSTTKPVYTSAAGTFAECSTYAGGTAVTLNGTSKAASTASMYAPTSAGTSGQVLVSSGSGAPTWKNVASVQTCQDIISELS